MAVEEQALAQAKERLSELDRKISEAAGEVQGQCDSIVEGVREVLKRAEQSRTIRLRLENLRAESLYLRMHHDLPIEEQGSGMDSHVKACEMVWKEVRSALQPVRAGSEWLDKIRRAEQERIQRPVLSDEDREELERRLKDNVCPICVSFALDGSCTLQAFETCPIDHYLNRLVQMIQEMGHRPWMEDYFEKMYREICPGCSGRIDKDYCPPREDGDCSLYSYLPTIVRTIEDFLRERDASTQRA